MRAVIAVLVFACLAAGAWFAFDSSEIQPPPAAPITVKAGVPIAAADTQTAPLPTDKEQPARSAVEADANQREAVAPQFAGPTLEVQVVHHDTKAPIAEATVYCSPDFSWRKLSPESKQQLLLPDVDAFLALTTDSDGRCRVPLGKGVGEVNAVKDELWGQADLRKDAAEPTVIALRTDRTLQVLVVDAGGKPVRGSMVLGKRKKGNRPVSSKLGETNATGRLELRHVQLLANEGAAARIECVASKCGGESAPVLVDTNAPPPEVVLQLPPGGTVTVHVRDAEGNPVDPTFLAEPSVLLGVSIAKPRERGEIVGQDVVPLDERGDAVFCPVAFDRFVMARTSSSDQGARGPTLESPYVEVTVQEGADDVVLTGTFVDAEGLPLTSSPYSGACKYKNGMSGLGGRTDASGRFRCSVPSLPAGQLVAVSFDTPLARAADPQSTPGQALITCGCELPPRLLTRGRNDLGEVRLP